MSKKLDLNNYLNKYIGGQDSKPTSFNDSMSRAGFQVETSGAKASRPATRQQSNYSEDSRVVTSHQTMGFHKAQVQCLEELQEVKRILAEEEKQINYFVSNYQKRVGEDLHRQHHRIRQEILEMFQRAFQTNEKRIDDALTALNSNQPIEFSNIRKRITQINHDINRLQQGLRSTSYRPVIAEVVTSDFDSVTRELQALVDSTQKTLYEHSPKLHINEQCSKRLQEDVLNIVVLDAHKEVKQRGDHSAPQPKKSTKNKLALFDSGKESEKSSFFNFK